MTVASSSFANAQSRSLKLYFIHTKEKAEIVYKRNGRYDPAGLKKINMFLRDWRRNEPTKMNPQLLDVIWEAYRQSGSKDYIHVVSAYRSPATNNMLRGRSRGVAKKSQHMLGKAMDWYVRDVPLKKLRNIGLKLQAGGVGYYPRSGSPFVHFDVGNVRHWPGISRSELVGVFPSGKTLHVPSDGKPLPGYEVALASYQSRSKSGSLVPGGGGNVAAAKRKGGLLAQWFGGGADQEEDDGESGQVTVAAAPPVAATRRAVAAKAPEPEIAIRSPADARPANRQPDITVLPPEMAAPANVRGQPAETLPAEAPAVEPAIAEESTPETIVAALPRNRVPKPMFAQRPKADIEEAPVEMAAVTPTARPVAPIEEPVEEPAAVAPAPAPAPRRAQTPADQGWQAGPPPVQTAAVRPQADIAPQAFASPEQQGNLPPGWQTGKQGVAKPGDEAALAALSNADVDTVAPRASGARVPKANVGSTVESTKTGRVKPGQKKAAKSKVVDAEVTAFATEKDVGATAPTPKVDVPTTSGKKSARAVMRAAPDAIYTSGFQQDGGGPDPSRFSGGKAVEFLPVKKFKQ